MKHMQPKERRALARMQRMEDQNTFLLRLYQTELARDPASLATASARSNLMALHHTITEIYGDAIDCRGRAIE